jgi:predicted RNA-binding protein YlxR (DUF448 family)
LKQRRQKLAIQTARERAANRKPKRTNVSPRSPKQDGEKKCVVTGKFYPKAQMIRFVLDDKYNLIPDIMGKMDGHGLWALADRKLLLPAFTSVRPFRRAIHGQVKIAPDIDELVGSMLVKRCQSLIGLARKGGFVTAGFSKVKEAIEHSHKGLLIVAPDASDGQIKKLGLEKEDIDVKIISPFSKEQLDEIFGFQDVVFVFVRKVRETAKLFDELARLELYCGNNACGLMEAAEQ